MDQMHSKYKKPKPPVKPSLSERGKKAAATRLSKSVTKREADDNAVQSQKTNEESPKRRRLCFGRQLVAVATEEVIRPNQPSANAAAGPSTVQDVPHSPPSRPSRPILTASRKKIEMFEEILPLCALQSDYGKAVGEYIIIAVKKLQELAQKLSCPHCKHQSMEIQIYGKKGFAEKLKVLCPMCGEVVSDIWCSTQVKDFGTTRAPFSINRTMTKAFLAIGLGHAGMATFGKTLGLNIMSKCTFDEHVKSLSKDLNSFRDAVLEESRRVVRELYVSEDPSLKDEDVINIKGSYDGSWMKRGFTSLYGLGFFIETHTGLVVDYEVLSKYCYSCVMAEKSMDLKSDEYLEWRDDHVKSGQCNMNYSGSSPGMETECAKRMWLRSESYGFRFQSVTSDGDNKTWSFLKELQPYGPDFQIEKEECVNHLSKRVYKNLEEIVKKCKAQKITLGGRGDGQLTQPVMAKLSGYYRKAIEENKESVPGMQKAIMATLHHCTSTDKKPKHTNCPVGKDSWCFYNRAKALKTKPHSHNEMSLKLNDTVVQHILPLYERLSDVELLKRCQKGGTQNANECLHSVVWHKVPKEIFVSKPRLEMGVVHAIAEFNMGLEASTYLEYQTQGQKVPTVSAQIARRSDEARMDRSESAPTRFERAASRKKREEVEKKRKKNEKHSYKAGMGD